MHSVLPRVLQRVLQRITIGLVAGLLLTGSAMGQDAKMSAAPKKLLVLSATMGYRHGSIPKLEAMLTELSKQSGQFTLDFVEQPAGKPADLKKDASPEQTAAYEKAEATWETSLKTELEKFSPESLKNYDGVIFASTTGDLPLPDPQGFLDWIKAGHAFIGLHAAGDSFHHWPAYLDMIGAEFKQHGAEVSVDCLNQDPENPATAMLPKVWTITREEIYQFKDYDPTKVHELLVLDKHPNDKTPGHYALAWEKYYGTGRVFYTALGHRDDIVSADPSVKNRANAPEISTAYQAHVLGGIQWALGLAEEMPAKLTAGEKKPLLDATLSNWEVWLGVPHRTVTGLTPATTQAGDGKPAPLGLNNDPKHVYSIEMDSGEPVLHVSGEIYGGLTTRQSFGNYHFHAQIKWGDRRWEPRLNTVRDNGVLFHCSGPHGVVSNAWKRSFEFQVQEKDFGDCYLVGPVTAQVTVVKKEKDWFFDPTGELKQMNRPGPNGIGGRSAHLTGNFEKPVGEWNDVDLYTVGRTAVYCVNGQVVQALRQTATLQGPEKTEVPITSGQIQLQSEAAETYYRKVEIEPITELPAEITKAAGL